MISVNEFKNGLTITVDGELWRVVEFQHVKPGKGSAFVRSKLKNLRTGAVQEKTFRAGEKGSTCTYVTQGSQAYTPRQLKLYTPQLSSQSPLRPYP